MITRFYRPRLACCHARQGARSAAAGQRGILPPRCRSRCRHALQLVEVSRPIHAGAGNLSGRTFRQIYRNVRPIHAGAGNLSAYERTKLALGRRYNRTKKAVGGQIPGSRVDQIDPPLSTAAKLAAEHSALRLVEVPPVPSSVHATGFEQIGWHLVTKRESPPSTIGRRA